LIVSVDGVIQTAPTNYTLSGSTITFTGVPDSGANVVVRHIGFRTTSTVTALQASSVTATEIADGSVTNAKIVSVANTKISGNIVSSQIAPSVTLTTPIISGNLNLDSAGTTGIRVPTANTISFHTAGTEDMRITSAGDVGIGTSNPVAGTGFTAQRKLIQVYSSTGSGNAQVHLGGTSGTMLDHDDSNYTIATLRNLYGASDARALMQIQSGYMTFGTGTSYTEAMRIDSSGRVTKPLQPAFYAYMNSGGSTLFASNANFVFDTVQYNTGSHYSTSTGRFTAPIAGWYHFSTTVLSQSRSNGDQMEIGLTNQTGGLGALGARQVYQSNYTGYGGYIAATASCTIYLNAGDYMRVTNSCGASVYINSGPWAFFSGHLVG
jgi:hypothetical protein